MNLEIFCCSGGMAEGFRRAGVTFDLSIDSSPDACVSYEANLGHRPIQIDIRDLLRMVRAGWSPGSVGLLVADPPCTPWSRAGKRLGVLDERDVLMETVDLIRLLQPAAYLIGNVPGLDDSTNWRIIQRLLSCLTDAGYCVRDYARLNAADYGVPQHRIRPFWFGHHSGTPCIAWPKPTHCAPEEVQQALIPGSREGLLPWVTCREALSHLSVNDLGRLVRVKISDRHHPPSYPDRPAKTVCAGSGGGATRALALNPRHPIASLDAPAMTVGARPRGAQGSSALAIRPHHAIPGPDEPARTITANRQEDDARFLGWPWDRRPSTTACCESRIAPPGHHGHSEPPRGPNAILLSEKAASALQGFPEDWVFAGKTKTARWSQIGQAMPPPLAEAVARRIRAQME